MASRGAPGSGVTAPYASIDETDRVELSRAVVRGTADTKSTTTGKPRQGSSRRIWKMPVKKLSRVLDGPKSSQVKKMWTCFKMSV